MKNLKIIVASAVGAAAMLLGTAASAAADFSGIWQADPFYATGEERIRTVDGLPLPMTPAAKAEFDYLEAREAAGDLVVHNTMVGWPKGFIQASRNRLNFKIIHQPKQVTFFFEEDHQYEIFHIDAKHPANVQPSFLGDSVAHWEGDTLVVDTIGYNGKTALNNYQTSDKLHTIMRMRLINDGKSIENIVTIDDPGTFTRTFQIKIVYNRRTERLLENVYAENERELVDLKDAE
jgi:hypothetical protein